MTSLAYLYYKLWVIPSSRPNFFCCPHTAQHSYLSYPGFPCWLILIYLTCRCWSSWASCLYTSSLLSLNVLIHNNGSHYCLCANDPQIKMKTLLWCPLLHWAVFLNSSSVCLYNTSSKTSYMSQEVLYSSSTEIYLSHVSHLSKYK